MGLLQDQVSLVTGGASGIGRAISEVFLREGARVALTYLTSAGGAQEMVTASGGCAIAIVADVSRAADVDRAIQETLDRFGRIDILVTNAGGLLRRSRIADCSEELWDRAQEVNLKSTFLCCKAVIPVMTRQGGGRRTEVEELSGYIAEEGHRLGVPVPYLRALTYLVQAVEGAGRQS